MPSRARRARAENDTVVPRFVIPLAGFLTIVSTRLFDLGAGMSDSEEVTASIADGRVVKGLEDEEVIDQEHPMRHAVTVLVIGLFTASFIILCVGFGGMYCNLPTHHKSLLLEQLMEHLPSWTRRYSLSRHSSLADNFKCSLYGRTFLILVYASFLHVKICLKASFPTHP